MKAKKVYLTIPMRQRMLELERANELLHLRFKAMKIERDTLQAQLINRETMPVKMLRQIDDYKAARKRK